MAEPNPIKDWLPKFLKRHRARYSPADWPHPESEEWQVWVQVWYENFRDLGVTEPEADTASRRLGRNPPQWQRDHIPAILREVEAIRQANAQAAAPESRDEAWRQSRNCPWCQGQGMLRVYHPRSEANAVVTFERPDGSLVRQPGHVGAHCACPLGKWMRAKLSAEDRRLFANLADIEAGRSRWLAEDPTADIELEARS